MRRAIQGTISEPQRKVKIATIKDEKSSGTNGQASSTSYIQLDLNTLDDPSNIGITLSADRFTLPAGNYFIKISGPAFGIARHKIKLVRDPAGSPTDQFIGESAHDSGSGATHSRGSESVLLTSAVEFEVQHRADAVNVFGLAVTYGDVEVYAIVEIMKF